MKRLFTSFFILLTASGLWAQGPYDQTYTKTLEFANNQAGKVFTSEINVTDSGTLEDLDIKFNMTSGQAKAHAKSALSELSEQAQKAFIHNLPKHLKL